MAAPIDPAQVQATYTAPAEAPAETPAAAPAGGADGSTEEMRDRILTPDETARMLRGEAVTPADAQLDNADDPEQAQMAADFFAEVPAEPHLTPAAQLPTPPQPTPPVPPVEVLAPAAVQADLQSPPVQPQEPVPVVAPPVAAAPSPEMAALTAQNQLLTQQIAMLQAQVAQPAPSTPAAGVSSPSTPQPGGSAAPAQQEFNFNVPDQFLEALGSDDRNQVRAALNSLLSGTANAVATQVRQEMGEGFASHRDEILNSARTQGQEQQQAQAVYDDMYGTYPELAQFRSFVQTASAQVVPAGLGTSAWSPDVRDLIAERVAPMVPGLMQRINQNRAQRLGQQQVGVVPQAAPVLPQGLVPQASGMVPGTPVGSMHGAAVAQAPLLVRDHQGNLIQATPAVPLAGPQARPGAGTQVSPELADIWNTLGY